jgi:hypothetical protein
MQASRAPDDLPGDVTMTHMAAEVTAAWIAAAASIAAAVANIGVGLVTERKRRDAELIANALEYFQGSQRRSVGLAALAVLRTRRRAAWNEYKETIAELFYRQLLYLLTDGENRWKAHEISNIEGMANWLIRGELPRLEPEMQRELHSAMTRYKTTKEHGKREKGADPEAIDRLSTKISEWQAALSPPK